MSQTNSPGEEDEGRDPISEDFEFYFPFAKTLALDLPIPEDTSIAAAWVQKLEAEPESEEEKRTRLNYLKLLLFVLQRGRLIGLFRKQPPSGALQPFPQGLSVLDMGNLMLDQDDTPTCGEGDARCFPYTIEISNDLREFVASQEIPNFGVQMYYAWSSEEPVHKWLSFDGEKFPQFVLEKIKQLKEVKSDEKSTIVKNGCLGPKTGCDLPLLEKCARKKVKSPQEIEKSQGRSFHTYVGLVGRMGNFSDKCGDDPEKCQRQDPRRGKCPRRNMLQQYPGSGGEAEEMPAEDELTNFLAGVGGINSLNRPCLCPTLGGRPHYPEHCGKGGSQHFQEQQTPRMNYTFSLGDRKQPENSQWSTAESRPLSQQSYNEEQCPESLTPLRMQSQRRSPSPRPKSNSPNRPNYDCPPQDDIEIYNRDAAVCSSTSPVCTCPCPRAAPQEPMRKTPSSTNASVGGRGPVDPNQARTKQVAGGNRVNREDPCVATPQGPDPGSSGAGRSGGGPRPNTRTRSPQIIHCFDSQNPDPCLTQTISKLESLNWSEEVGGNAFPGDNVKDCFANEKLAQPTFQKVDTLPQREVYDACQQQAKIRSPTCAPMSSTKQKSDRCSPPMGQRPRSPRTPSPQPGSCPVRQIPQEPLSQQCRPNQQLAQNYQECARPAQMRPPPTNVCGGPASDSCRPPSQPGNQPENIYAFLDKFPPDCPGFTPPSFENVFVRPAADSCSPLSPHWNQREYLYDFLDKFASNAPGRNTPATDDVCGKPAAVSCRPPPQTGNQPEDLYAFLEKNFPPNPSAPAPSALTKKPSQVYPDLSDVFRRPAADTCRPPPQPGNQRQDLCAFLENFSPNAPASYPNLKERDDFSPTSCGRFPPVPSGLTAKPGRMRTGIPDVCGRPAAVSCRPPPQTGNQPEDLYAFLEKNFPPNPSAPAAPGRKSARIATAGGLLQGINQRGEAHREKCDQFEPKKLPASDVGFCRPSGQPPANVCPEQGLPGGGAMVPNYCGESRPPRAPVCPDTGAYRRHPIANPKSANLDRCPGGPPNKGKTTTFMAQQPHTLRQPMPLAYRNAGEKACDADEEICATMCARKKFGENSTASLGPKQRGNAQICKPQAMMPGRSHQQEPCANVWSGVQSCVSQRPIPGGAGGNEASRPNREAEMQNCMPQRVTSGKTPQQEQRRVVEVQSTAPKRISPGKTRRQEAAIYREPNMQTSSYRKMSPGKAAEEECIEVWDDKPSSVSQMGRSGKLSKQASNAIECLGMQGGAVQMPNAGASFRNDSRKSKEADIQSCPPQNLGPGKAVNQNQNAEEWSELASHFSERTNSGGSRKNDETPTWLPLVWGRKSPEAAGPRPQEANIQGYNPSQRKSPGRPPSQEATQTCTQPANPTRRISPRVQPSQNKLSRQKSSSRTYQSLSDTKSKTVRKTKPSPSKSEMSSDNHTTTKSKFESKIRPKVKSETQMKIKPETQLKIKSEPNMKFKSKSKVKIECVSKNPMFETKRKVPRQISFKDNEGVPGCSSQGQQNVMQDCAEYLIQNYGGNPYTESSLMYHKNRLPLFKTSSPNEWLDTFPQNNSPAATTISHYDPQCEYNNMNEQIQMDFCEDEDDSIEYLPLYSLNTDLSTAEFFTLPQRAPRNDQRSQEAFDPNCALDQPRNNPQEVSFQTFQDDENALYCDSPDNGFY